MRKGKFANRKGVTSKTLIMVLALVMVVGCTVGGTLAWLTDTTEAKVNTFTVGKVDIDLTETTSDYKMVPGNTIAKDPKVTVNVGSEKCYVFVKITESDNLDTYITYSVASGWTELDATKYPGVYYRVQDALTGTNAEAVTYSVLANDSVTVNSTVTAADMKTAEISQPTLTFTAYAIQYANSSTGNFTPEAAWTTVSA